MNLRHQPTVLLSLMLLAALAGCDRPAKEYHFGGTVKTVFSYNSRAQLHGVIRHYDQLGKLWKEETWENGKKNGPARILGAQGQTLSQVRFADDRMQGVYRAYYDGGELRAECFYDRGVLHGPFKKYYRSGVLESEATYAHGAKNGPETLYYPGGGPQLSAYYNAGDLDCPVIEFYESGAVRSVQSYRDNRLDGVSKEYFESGRLKSEMLFGRGKNLVTIEYDESGAVVSTTENKKDFNFLKKTKPRMPSYYWH